jgi:hypothetical protein
MKSIKQTICIIIVLLFIGITANAQVKVVNEEGEVIILMPDGTWKYDDAEKEKMRQEKAKMADIVTEQPIVKVTKENPKKNTDKAKNDKNKTELTKTNKNTTENKAKGETTKPKTVGNTPSKPNQKQKAVVYDVPKRERKIKTPVIVEPVCDFTMKEKDEFTNKLKVGLAPRFFFSYTQEELKKFMRGKNYVTCTGALSEVVGMTTFNVKFEIESPSAQKEYGEINSGTQMLVKLLNGKTVTLTCQESDKGTVDEVNGRTIYRTYFGLDKGDISDLKKSEVVRVRMLWSTGYEDYEVNELDFFIHQLKCLESIKE